MRRNGFVIALGHPEALRCSLRIIARPRRLRPDAAGLAVRKRSARHVQAEHRQGNEATTNRELYSAYLVPGHVRGGRSVAKGFKKSGEAKVSCCRPKKVDLDFSSR